jgi:hypothetical protein
MIYSETGDFRSGLESLRQAKEEAKGAEQHLTLAWIDYRIAQIYFRSDSFDVATELAFDSLDSFARLQHRYGTGHCRLLLSQIFGRTGRLPSAVQVGEEALETFANCGDWWMERLAAIELAKRKVSDGSTAEATQLARRAINLGEPRLSLSRLGMHIAWELVKGSLVRPAAPLLTSMARDLAVSRKD